MKIILILVGVLIAGSGYSQSDYYPSDHSYLDSKRYSNEYFGFEMPILSSWNVLNTDQIKNAISTRVSNLGNDFDVHLDKDRVERIRQEDLILLVLSKSSSMQDLPNLMISWEPLLSDSQILTSAGYLNDYVIPI